MFKIVEINCKDCNYPTCIHFCEREINQPLFINNFPSYPSSNICVTNAIELKNGKVTINTEKCILCGICQVRCSMKKNFLPDFFKKESDFFYTTNKKIEAVFSKISKAKRNSPILPNLLVRNLLLTLGVPASILKKGVTSIRTDLITDSFVGEIEFNDSGAGDILGIPRSILDDVAVICSRYGKNINSFRKIAVVDRFPHVRSEYWEVINDIHKITGIKIETISLLTLIAKVWSDSKNPNIQNFEFYIDNQNLNYRDIIFSKFCNLVNSSNIHKCEEMDVVTQTK